MSSELDLPVLVSLGGTGIEDLVLTALEERGLGGVRSRHGYVFQRLLAGPATATEMARALGVSQQAMSKTVRELLALGFVAEERDPHDARRRPVALTGPGREVVEVSRQARRSLEERLRAAVGEERADVAADVLHVMLELLGLAEPVSARSCHRRRGPSELPQRIIRTAAVTPKTTMRVRSTGAGRCRPTWEPA